MSANKKVTLGPVALTATTTTNIFSPPKTFTTAGDNPPPNSVDTFYNITHVHVGNTTASAIQFALWLTTTRANTTGSEFIAPCVASAGTLSRGVSVAALSVFGWYGSIRVASNDANKFIVGGATAGGITLQSEAEMGMG